ncbi:type II toxin-antitoxin system VapC family toxin [Massilia sp. BJB1822]|uniref:type II toxin-antitoxin system VapC family toxin n=1 Tax=Massilia sp. BJB1822 TaxID=2744470 RepID=UPI001C3C8CBD|nr:type II toxin-antitoxin system VapC family toxin [Massilia sp. BJB1822]
MMYLLDTNAISEMRRLGSGKCDPRFAAWANDAQPGELFLSAITILELEIGVLRAERNDAPKGQVLRTWLNKRVLPVFWGRILPVTTSVALRSAQLHVPNPCSLADGLIAATAALHDLTLVTRNVHDFRQSGVRLVNPWEGSRLF